MVRRLTPPCAANTQGAGDRPAPGRTAKSATISGFSGSLLLKLLTDSARGLTMHRTLAMLLGANRMRSGAVATDFLSQPAQPYSCPRKFEAQYGEPDRNENEGRPGRYNHHNTSSASTVAPTTVQCHHVVRACMCFRPDSTLALSIAFDPGARD